MGYCLRGDNKNRNINKNTNNKMNYILMIIIIL